MAKTKMDDKDMLGGGDELNQFLETTFASSPSPSFALNDEMLSAISGQGLPLEQVMTPIASTPSPIVQTPQAIPPMPTGPVSIPEAVAPMSVPIAPAPMVSATPVMVERAPSMVPEVPKPEQKRMEKQVMQSAIEGYQAGAFEVGKQKGMLDEVETLTTQFKERQKANERALSEANQKANELESEAAKLEPQDFWASKSTGSKVAAALAIGLGAYSAGMLGGPNRAKEIIDDAIQRDLYKQKEQYQRAKERGAVARNQYGELVKRLGSEEAADLTQLANAYKMIDTRLRVSEQGLISQERKMNIQKMQADINASYQAARAKQIEMFAKQAALQAPTGQGAPLPRGVLSEKDEARYIRDTEFFGLAPTEGEAKEFRKTLPGYRTTLKDLTRLYEISKVPFRSVTPTLRAEARALGQRLVGAMREDILEPGVITKDEREFMLEDVIGSPQQILSLQANTQTRLKSLVDSLQYRKSEQAKILGLNHKPTATELNRVTVRYQGQNGWLYKDVTADQAAKMQAAASERGVPFEFVTGETEVEPTIRRHEPTPVEMKPQARTVKILTPREPAKAFSLRGS